jgi:hypothetical protein
MRRTLSWALAVVMLVTLSFGVTGATAAGKAGTKTQSFGVAGGPCYTGGQICPTTPIALTSLASYSSVTAVFTLEAIHCSDVAVVLFVDGHEVGTTPFAPPGVSTETVTVPWPKDGETHSLSYEGKGEEGGCNGGNLVTWSGSLAVTYTPKKLTTISGRLVMQCGGGCHAEQTPIANAAVDIRGDANDSTRTNAKGEYEALVPRGSYTVVPHVSGLHFTPPRLDVTVSHKSVGHQDFSGCGASGGGSASSASPEAAGASSSERSPTKVTNVDKDCSNTIEFLWPPFANFRYEITWRSRLLCIAEGLRKPVYDAYVGEKTLLHGQYDASARDGIVAVPTLPSMIGSLGFEVLDADKTPLLSLGPIFATGGPLDKGGKFVGEGKSYTGSPKVQFSVPNHLNSSPGSEQCGPEFAKFKLEGS